MNSESAITPEQIDAQQFFWDAFGNMETEISAARIVLFCQERGQGWASFTREEIEAFYHAKGRPENFRFNGLIRPGDPYIVQEGETYTVTPAFVQACYIASPVV